MTGRSHGTHTLKLSAGDKLGWSAKFRSLNVSRDEALAACGERLGRRCDGDAGAPRPPAPSDCVIDKGSVLQKTTDQHRSAVIASRSSECRAPRSRVFLFLCHVTVSCSGSVLGGDLSTSQCWRNPTHLQISVCKKGHRG